jgi:hypothetical protein
LVVRLPNDPEITNSHVLAHVAAMSTGCWRIKPSELEQTLKSIRSVGLHVKSVELAADGIIKITVSDAEMEGAGNQNPETPDQLRKLL